MSSDNDALDRHYPLSMDELRTELAVLEADFTSLTYTDLHDRLTRMHYGFELDMPHYYPGAKIFRAVRVKSKPLYKACVSYPPPDRVTKDGRLNRAREVMFYGSVDRYDSCLYECRCAVGDIFAVSVWKTTKTLTLNHLGYSPEAMPTIGANGHMPRWIERDETNERNALIRAWQARVFTRLVPEGQEHLYKLGIALRDFALGPIKEPNPDQTFFAGIVYPSMSMGLLGDNVALLPSVVDSSLLLEEVLLLEMKSILPSLDDKAEDLPPIQLGGSGYRSHDKG